MTPKKLVQFIADQTDCKFKELMGNKRLTGYASTVKHAALYYVRQFFPGISENEQADMLDQDRSSIRNSLTAFNSLMESDSQYRAKMIELEELIKRTFPNPSLSYQIDKALKTLLISGQLVNQKNWQSVSVNQGMHEITHYYFTADIPWEMDELQKECKPHLPWAEDHFKERIYPENFNPGVQYQYWPFYKKDSFKEYEGRLFSHTYMERFHPHYAGTKMVEPGYDYDGGDESMYKNKGIRYDYGGLADIIDRIKKDRTTRQAYLTVWHPEDQSNEPERRLPCTLGYQFLVRNNRLHITYHIRSCDALRHFKNDVYMACRLAQYVAKQVGVKPGRIDMWMGSFHCFESDLYTLRKKIFLQEGKREKKYE